MSRLRNLNATDRAMLASRWEAHASHCRYCAMYRPDVPATLAQVCIEGAPIIKEVLIAQAERDHANKRARDLRSFKKGLQSLPEPVGR